MKKIKKNLRDLSNNIPGIYTSSLRVLPDFLIIGAKRCGSSSLYNYLVQHPCIMPAKQKELHFFAGAKKNNYSKGMKWYRGNFPTAIQKKFVKSTRGHALTGEATPHYLSNLQAPERVCRDLPDIKLIYILRNPVDRAYSHYRLESRKGREDLSFEQAVALESEKKLDGKIEINATDLKIDNSQKHCRSYIRRGLYEKQLKKWFSLFPQERFFFVHSERFFEDPELILNNVFKFLGLPGYKLKEYKKFQESKNGPENIDPGLRKKLVNYYKPYNRRLYDLLGQDLEWDQ